MTAAQRKRLAVLAEKPDVIIDYSDIPPDQSKWEVNDVKFKTAINQAVSRWIRNPSGEKLTPVPFEHAIENKCHDNAMAYASRHGGKVVHGFLITRPHDWTSVLVYAHSVVRLGGNLLDPSLRMEQLMHHSFYSLNNSCNNFKTMALLFPEVRYLIESAKS